MTRTARLSSALNVRARQILAPCLCVLALTGLRCDRGDEPQLPRVEINAHVWRVVPAMTRAARYRGLSGRRSLGRDEGMLFIFPQPKVLEFCMRDCQIALDIAFIDSDLEVVRIHTMAVEPDGVALKTYKSDRPAMYALEVGAGELGRAKVKVGQKVTFLGPMPQASLAERDE